MASTTTQVLLVRVSNDDAQALHQLADTLQVPPSTLAAGCIARALDDREHEQTVARVTEAVELLKRRERCSDHSERRRLLLEALACLEEADERCDAQKRGMA